jgi:putative ABC transport system permease protein
MSDLSLIFSSLKSRCLNVALSVFLTAFGVMLAVLIIQFGNHIQNRLSVDGQGIDIVVGAKGSPLQLILSSVYHIDIPTGNIHYDDAEKWMKHRHVKTAIPLALGDNWKGRRIVGTTPAYMQHYNAGLAQGRVWNTAFEAVAGASVGLALGDEFAGAHGLTQGGHAHDGELYTVIGVMKPTGTVLDRLILTSLDSVLELHGLEGVEHNEHTGHHDHDAHKNHGHGHDDAAEAEITALLLTTKSPMANINLPRSINRESDLQAANPALEMVRLTSMLGMGSQSFAALSSLLIIIAALSIFSGLAGSLENRMGDLAVLRALGYSKCRVFKIITLEGMMIVISGLVLGIVMGVAGFSALSRIVTPLAASGASISFTADFILIVLAVLFAGLIAAALPAVRAARIDVARQLSRNA